MKEKMFYDQAKNWDFSHINYEEEILTKWDMYDILRKRVNFKSKVLDLGTGGGEHVLEDFPECAEILATDFSEEMIKLQKKILKNLKKSI